MKSKSILLSIFFLVECCFATYTLANESHKKVSLPRLSTYGILSTLDEADTQENIDVLETINIQPDLTTHIDTLDTKIETDSEPQESAVTKNITPEKPSEPTPEEIKIDEPVKETITPEPLEKSAEQPQLNKIIPAEKYQAELPAAPALAPTQPLPPTQGNENHKDVSATLKKLERKEDEISIEEKEEEVAKAPSDEDEPVEFHFENADLQNLISQIAELYNITFITDEMINPLGPSGKALKGNKISFKTHQPLSKKDAWNLFITFLDLAGFSVVPEADPRFFKIVTLPTAKTSPVTTYIGVNSETLPDNDQIIRYVYFIENSPTDTIKSVVDMLKSPDGQALVLEQTRAIVLTDRAYNIKMLMKIIVELDKVSMPQSMSVLKLKRTDAKTVKGLLDSIIKQDDKDITARLFPARKQPTSLYFPENTRIFDEPRTNTLILLGPKDAIEKIEEFIVKHVDVELDKPYSPLYVYDLKYADAPTVAEILNNVTQFGKATEAGKSGGIRAEDKYLKPMAFTPEKATNRLIIKGEYDDYMMVKEIIEKLDEVQPQVAIEILILSVSLKDAKELGVQLRSKEPGPEGFIGKNVEFQTSGLRAGGAPKGIVENSEGMGASRLLGDLIKLVSGAGAGNTVLSLGMDKFGVWGVFQALQTVTNAQVVSNPFLTATNNTQATVELGEVRRVVTGTVVGTEPLESFGNEPAKLTVAIKPQINSDGMIVLDIDIKFDEFIEALSTSADKTTRKIKTNAIVADKEVLALGGLIRNRIEDSTSKTPLLGDIPILGWLFKNKSKNQNKDNLLILISTRIIQPEASAEIDKFTKERIKDYKHTLANMQEASDAHDPIYKKFFEAKTGGTEKVLDDFILKRRGVSSSNQDKPQKIRKRKRRKSKKKKASDDSDYIENQLTITRTFTDKGILLDESNNPKAYASSGKNERSSKKLAQAKPRCAEDQV